MSDEFPFTGYSDEYEEELPLFEEYAWDFEQDKFIYDGNGRHLTVQGKEAVKVWIYKALKTERYQYLVYSWGYGIELKPFIGKVMSVQERLSELKRVIVECLMVNPYIKSIDSIEFVNEGDTVQGYITLTTVYGEVEVSV